MKSFGFGLAVLLLSGVVLAAGPRTAARDAELSMVVTGTVEIARDGTVSAIALDEKEMLPEFVVRLIERAAPGWRFEPARHGGEPVSSTANMHLNVVASPSGDDYRVALRHARFVDRNARADEVRSRSLTPPRYPAAAVQSGARGVVFLLLRLDAHGAVAEAAVEQVNLRVAGSASRMEHARRQLGDASLKAARNWTFELPAGDAGPWVVRMPVDFELLHARKPSYGQWVAYIPGPRQLPDWVSTDDGEPDAVAAGKVHRVGSGMRLLTPLQEEEG